MTLTIERNTLGFTLRMLGPVTMGNKTPNRIPQVWVFRRAIAQGEPQGVPIEEWTTSATRAEFISSNILEELSSVEASGQTSEQEDRAQTISYLAMRGAPPSPPEGGWRSTLGMFANDPMMARIVEAGRQIRESERHE